MKNNKHIWILMYPKSWDFFIPFVGASVCHASIKPLATFRTRNDARIYKNCYYGNGGVNPRVTKVKI
jgi:hypothetical protein